MKALNLMPIILLLAACATASTVAETAPAPSSSTQSTPTASAQTTSQPTTAEPSLEEMRRGFKQWVAAYRQQAAREGVNAATLTNAFDDAQLLERVIELDGAQPEFTRAIWEYLDSAVSDSRVSTGRTRLAENQAAANAAAQSYGVPAKILVAIWGIESNYGSNFGNYETIDALATLGYHGRREDFAKRELLAALKILQSGDISRERMQGSWAGGMGHTQFLPTSFQAYAVDGDDDGRRDIWGSIPDVMASTANYLAKARWKTGQPWGVEVVLPEGFDFSNAELDTKFSSREWAGQGVRAAKTGALPEFEQASVIVPAGANGPAFLVGPNFHAILRYNNSTSYALAVGHLADRIDGGDAFVAQWPRNLASLSRSQIKELQQQLSANGYSTGTPDGLVGPNTRKALRAYQRDKDWVADGYPTFAILQSLQTR